MFIRFSVFAIYAHAALAAGLFGKFENVPQDAIDAAGSGLESPIVNGLNFQSRIHVSLMEISKNTKSERIVLPVDRNYRFEAPHLPAGEYQLQISAYDFTIPNPRYKIFVHDTQIEAFVDNLGSPSFNVSSKHVVSSKTPLSVSISGFKSYYENSEGRLLAMVMNSPLGVIFKSKLYSALFFGTLAIIVFPYVIPYISPDFAETFQELQREADEAHQSKEAPQEKETKKIDNKFAVPLERAVANAQRAKRRK